MTDLKLAKQCAEVFAALSDPYRVQVIEALRSGTKNVTQLSRLLNVELVNVSHHLGVLREYKLVKTEKKGRFVLYSLNADFFRSEPNNTTVMELGWCRIEIPHN
jgi:ArsR family transcriptional regulator, nickel/cobalt-responsive transcriptional repressor